MACYKDVLVKWDKDNSKNVVSLKDLLYEKDKPIEKGLNVKMWLRQTKTWWTGVVIDVATILDSDDDNDNIPLARFLSW